MPDLSIRSSDEENARRLKVRPEREGISLDENVRRILQAAVDDEEPLGTLIRRIVGKGIDLEPPKREFDGPIDFASDDYLPAR